MYIYVYIYIYMYICIYIVMFHEWFRRSMVVDMFLRMLHKNDGWVPLFIIPFGLDFPENNGIEIPPCMETVFMACSLKKTIHFLGYSPI